MKICSPFEMEMENFKITFSLGDYDDNDGDDGADGTHSVTSISRILHLD